MSIVYTKFKGETEENSEKKTARLPCFKLLQICIFKIAFKCGRVGLPYISLFKTAIKIFGHIQRSVMHLFFQNTDN